MPQPFIRTFLDLSTEHLDEESVNWINAAAAGGDEPVGFMPHGWFCWAPEEYGDAEPPACLKRIHAYAREHGAEYILFDGDAEALADLPLSDHWS